MTFVVVALLMAVIFGVNVALVLAAPSMVIVLSGLLSERLAQPSVEVAVDRSPALEGDVVTLRVTVAGTTAVPLLDIEMEPDPALGRDGPMRMLTSLGASRVIETDFAVRVDEWGVVALGHLTVRARDRFGLVVQRNRYLIVSSIPVSYTHLTLPTTPYV